jgi:hypothetical protein
MAPPAIAPVAAALLLAALASLHGAAATGVFQVHRKFTRAANITVHLAHDVGRHGRLLAAADVPLGGLGLPTGSGYAPTPSLPPRLIPPHAFFHLQPLPPPSLHSSPSSRLLLRRSRDTEWRLRRP